MDLNNKSQTRLFVVIVSILSIILAALVFRYRKNDFQEQLDWNFKGVAEKVYYNYKGIPYVTIYGKEYSLIGLIRNLDYKIKNGDTVIKQKGDYRIKIIRPNSRDTIYDRNPLYDPKYKKGN